MLTVKDQDALRLRLSALKAEYGSTNRFVATKTGIDESAICLFCRGVKNLRDYQYDKLDDFLAAKGFKNDLECLTVLIQGR